ncbi:hypothetical protein SNEBB_003847 [Seison nebaliae]|nr:hypothetical protein SNEBB_003847 [Seison nebaliae]
MRLSNVSFGLADDLDLESTNLKYLDRGLLRWNMESKPLIPSGIIRVPHLCSSAYLGEEFTAYIHLKNMNTFPIKSLKLHVSIELLKKHDLLFQRTFDCQKGLKALNGSFDGTIRYHINTVGYATIICRVIYHRLDDSVSSFMKQYNLVIRSPFHMESNAFFSTNNLTIVAISLKNITNESIILSKVNFLPLPQLKLININDSFQSTKNGDIYHHLLHKKKNEIDVISMKPNEKRNLIFYLLSKKNHSRNDRKLGSVDIRWNRWTGESAHLVTRFIELQFPKLYMLRSKFKSKTYPMLRNDDNDHKRSIKIMPISPSFTYMSDEIHQLTFLITNQSINTISFIYEFTPIYEREKIILFWKGRTRATLTLAPQSEITISIEFVCYKTNSYNLFKYFTLYSVDEESNEISESNKHFLECGTISLNFSPMHLESDPTKLSSKKKTTMKNSSKVLQSISAAMEPSTTSIKTVSTMLENENSYYYFEPERFLVFILSTHMNRAIDVSNQLREMLISDIDEEANSFEELIPI